jgi:uncharacterized membrane-anchored protein YjiN (DUF445 family)
MSEINNEDSFAQMRNEMDVQNANTIASLKADLAEAQAEVDRLKNVVEYTGQHLKSWSDNWTKVQSFIQTSIDNEEFSESELEEPFWEELAELLGLDLKLTEEVEVAFLQTWSGTVTVKKGEDFDTATVESELPWDLAIDINGETHYLSQSTGEFDF